MIFNWILKDFIKIINLKIFYELTSAVLIELLLLHELDLSLVFKQSWKIELEKYPKLLAVLVVS